jgi:ADP-ribose pyrophosphatase YjhB (NUDIX family)
MPSPGVLARGPWPAGRVEAQWRETAYEPGPEQAAEADRAIAALAGRGSPAHDGVAARLAAYDAADGRLRLELEPMRWGLRLVAGDAADALSVLCLVRDADGRWLAGRRAPWVATWAGRWALGAGGAVEVGEDPVAALARELEEEWAVRADELAVEALVRSPDRMAMLVGSARLAAGARVRADAEHDAHAWWPADVADWPPEAHPDLARMAELVA